MRVSGSLRSDVCTFVEVSSWIGAICLLVVLNVGMSDLIRISMLKLNVLVPSSYCSTNMPFCSK